MCLVLFIITLIQGRFSRELLADNAGVGFASSVCVYLVKA